jgi:hypothetical protein
MATDLQSAPFVHLGTCPNIVKFLVSALPAQKQTIPHTVLLLLLTTQGITVQDGQSAIPEEAVNFTSDIHICQVGREVFCISSAF